MTNKLTMTAEEILDGLVEDYIIFQDRENEESFSFWAGTILHRIIDMDKTYETDSELSDAEPIRPADMYERRIAVLERENQNLKMQLEQSHSNKDTLAPVRQTFINQVTDLVNRTYQSGVNPIEFLGRIRAFTSEYFEKCENECEKHF